MIQNFTKEEFEKIIEKKDSLSPSSKMLIDVYELLISIYQTVDDKTINELNSYFKNVGVPKFSDVINELNSGNAEVVGVPIIIEEKTYNSTRSGGYYRCNCTNGAEGL